MPPKKSTAKTAKARPSKQVPALRHLDESIRRLREEGRGELADLIAAGVWRFFAGGRHDRAQVMNLARVRLRFGVPESIDSALQEKAWYALHFADRFLLDSLAATEGSLDADALMRLEHMAKCPEQIGENGWGRERKNRMLALGAIESVAVAAEADIIFDNGDCLRKDLLERELYRRGLLDAASRVTDQSANEAVNAWRRPQGSTSGKWDPVASVLRSLRLGRSTGKSLRQDWKKWAALRNAPVHPQPTK